MPDHRCPDCNWWLCYTSATVGSIRVVCANCDKKGREKQKTIYLSARAGGMSPTERRASRATR